MKGRHILMKMITCPVHGDFPIPHDQKQALKKTRAEWLGGWDWEWFLSLNLPSTNYDHYLKRFRKRLAIEEKLCLAFYGLINLKPQPHLHLVMLGVNRHGKTLKDVSPEKWEREWGSIARRSARIEPATTQDGIFNYMHDKNMPDTMYSEIVPYGTNILKRLQKKLH